MAGLYDEWKSREPDPGDYRSQGDGYSPTVRTCVRCATEGTEGYTTTFDAQMRPIAICFHCKPRAVTLKESAA